MKPIFLKCLIVITMLIMETAAFSQNIKFSYDASGNRISRITVTKSTNTNINDSIVPETINMDQKIANLQISVYPNPTTDIIHISCVGGDDGNITDALLFTSNGEKIHSLVLKNADQIIDLNNLPSGVYFLKIQSNDKFESWKIVKQ